MEFIHAPKACASVGPYSHCVKAGSTYYLCGQGLFTPLPGSRRQRHERTGRPDVGEHEGRARSRRPYRHRHRQDDGVCHQHGRFLPHSTKCTRRLWVNTVRHVSVWKSATLPTAVCWKWMPSALKSKGRHVAPPLLKDTFIRFDGNMFFLRYMGIGKNRREFRRQIRPFSCDSDERLRFRYAVPWPHSLSSSPQTERVTVQ